MKTHGPGKYDDLCMHAMREAHADAVVLLVLGGTRGPGISVKTIDAEMLHALPAKLEGLAKQLREQIAQDARE